MLGLAMGRLGLSGRVRHDDRDIRGVVGVVGDLEVETSVFEDLRPGGMGLQEVCNRTFLGIVRLTRVGL